MNTRKPRCTCPRNHFVPNLRCPVHGKAAKAMAEEVAAKKAAVQYRCTQPNCAQHGKPTTAQDGICPACGTRMWRMTELEHAYRVR